MKPSSKNLILLILFAMVMLSTDGSFAETITMKSGKVIEGVIIERTDREIKIRKTDGNVWAIPFKLMESASAQNVRESVPVGRHTPSPKSDKGKESVPVGRHTPSPKSDKGKESVPVGRKTLSDVPTFQPDGPLTKEMIKEAERHFDKGYAFHMQGDLDRALAEYEMSMSYSPLYNKPLLNAAQIKISRKEPEGARVYLDKFVQQFPQEPEGHYLSGYADFLLGEIESARVKYGQALKFGYQSPPNQQDLLGRYLDSLLSPMLETIEFESELTGTKRTVRLAGPLLGDEMLYRKALPQVERHEEAQGREDLFDEVIIRLIRTREDKGFMLEQWTIRGTASTRDIYVRHDIEKSGDPVRFGGSSVSEDEPR